MVSVQPFSLPPITDDSILHVSRLLGLPPSAFADTVRSQLLKSLETMDVAACPGSGKTTLLVAKLAILAENWHSRTRGICVLSHTNVARNEIESRLGGSSVGRVLLSYPHFIGTIHGFVNDFLAMPWLRSKKYPIVVIDNETCERRRWFKLAYGSRTYLTRNKIDESTIRITHSDFTVAKKKGELPCGVHTPTYQDLKAACQESAEEGYHCFDDMFLWARDLLDNRPDVALVIRERFPLLLLDEAQDNSEDQSEILYRIFSKGTPSVVRQRFGDSNQAIFDSVVSEEASTDRFPDDSIRKDLPSSHRFGPRIAKLVSPLGLTPHAGGVEGKGPKEPLVSGSADGQHTVFLFDETKLTHVFDAYGALLVETFSEPELRQGVFTAVGQVHRPPVGTTAKKIPHFLGDYWPEYDSRVSHHDSRSETFVQHVLLGISKATAAGSTYVAVEKIAEAFTHLAGLLRGEPFRLRYGSHHRHITEVLREHGDVHGRYKAATVGWAVRREPLDRDGWRTTWRDIVSGIAVQLSGASTINSEAGQFLSWPNNLGPSHIPIAPKACNNLYGYPKSNPKVSIRAGSIHSVKGQTHTATLVLETFWADNKGRHNLELLRPWLVGTKSGGQSEGENQKKRLKLHYVAMTRPTHLLCLAMKRTSLVNGTGELNQQMVQMLRANGWQIRSV